MHKILIAFAFLAALTSTASAETAQSSVALNVRAQPGTNHVVVDVLRPGERVTVSHCHSNWCFIQHRGPDGWVSANYLTRVSPRSHRIPNFNIWQKRRHYRNDPCDVDSTTAFHLEFGLYFTPLAKYCRQRGY